MTIYYIERKGLFPMKITATLLMLLVLFLPNTYPQEYTQWNLPEGAVARFGKGSVQEILYSPDGSRLAVQSSIGIWLYDTETYREVALLAGHTNRYAEGSVQPRWHDACQLGHGHDGVVVGDRDG